jgi:hypothetical protein
LGDRPGTAELKDGMQCEVILYVAVSSPTSMWSWTLRLSKRRLAADAARGRLNEGEKTEIPAGSLLHLSHEVIPRLIHIVSTAIGTFRTRYGNRGRLNGQPGRRRRPPQSRQCETIQNGVFSVPQRATDHGCFGHWATLDTDRDIRHSGRHGYFSRSPIQKLNNRHKSRGKK